MRQVDPSTGPKGLGGQWPQRSAERQVRRDAVAFARWLQSKGLPRCQAAALLGLRPATLGRWGRGWRKNHLQIHLLGRPQRPRDPLVRITIQDHLQELGPTAGLPTLRAMFPQVVRSELRTIQAQYRRRWHQENAVVTEELVWTTPGTIWAADFTETHPPIDGVFKQVLAVRDLASQMQLAALPVLAADAQTAMEVTTCLFAALGPPLLLKVDNGSPFIAGLFTQLLNHREVCKLLSPPLTPRYNGSIEAGNGPLKNRIFYEAARHGHPGIWTSDDLAAAVAQANATLRPWGAGGLTPREAWQARRTITHPERQQFLEGIRQARWKVLHGNRSRIYGQQ